MITTTPIRRKFQDLLVKERKSRDLKQKEVAAQIEEKRTTYAAWEEGRGEPTVSQLARLHEVFGDYFIEKLFQ